MMKNRFLLKACLIIVSAFSAFPMSSCGSNAIGNSQGEKETKSVISFFKSGTLEKTQFIEGDVFDPSGLTFYANYSNGETYVDVTDEVTFTPSTLAVNKNSVTAKYTFNGTTSTLAVTGFTVSPLVPTELTYSGKLEKDTYNIGDVFDPTGLTFSLNYNNGTSQDVTDKVRYKTTGLTASDNKVKVYLTVGSNIYNCEIEITVINKLSTLTVSGELIKTKYYTGDTFNPKGLTFTAIYEDLSKKDVTNKIAFSPSILESSTTYVVASYTEGGIEKTINISGFEVINVELVSLSYTGTLQKTFYYQDEDFSIKGLVFRATFNDGSSLIVNDQIVLAPSKITYGINEVIASLTIGGITKTCSITGFEVDNPNDFIERIRFDNGTTSVSNDATSAFYLNETGQVMLKVISTSSNLIDVCLSKDKEGCLTDRKSSFKFTKTSNNDTKFYLNKNFYENLPAEGMSFDIYSTIAINSNSSALNMTDGQNSRIFSFGHTHPANKWITYSLEKNKISSDGLFLQLHGSTSGTYYIDNIRANTSQSYFNGGTFYFSKDEEIVIPRRDNGGYVTQLMLDNELLDESKFVINENNIILKDLINGEHKLNYSKKVNKYSGNTTSIYFGSYKATEQISKSVSLTYGSSDYTQIDNVDSKVNKVVFNNKAIAFEQSGSSILIPNAQILECLNKNGVISSGTISLILVAQDYNAICKEIILDVSVPSSSALESREYSTNKTYETFGYSATSGGVNHVDSQTEDMFMEYDRSGLENVYEQATSISSDNPVTLSSFYGGSNDRVRRDLELCEKLGKKCYLIDSYIRNMINHTSQPDLIGNGCRYPAFEDMVYDFYNRVSVYKVFPSLKKIVICDEPRFHSLVAVGQIYKALKQALEMAGRSDIEIDANLLPLNAGIGSDGIGDLEGSFASHIKNYPKRTAVYKNYLKTFLEETGANYISYDAYPLWDGSISSSSSYSNSVDEHAYSNLIVAAQFAKENNVELHVVTESFTATNRNSGKNRRVMSRDDLHWLCNQLMGFGVTRVSFFTYYSRAYNSTEFNINGDKNNSVGCFKQERYDENNIVISSEKTPVWYNAQGMLEEMNEFKNIALNFGYETSNMLTGKTVTKKQDNPSRGSGSGYAYPIEWAELVDNDNFDVGPLTNVNVDKEYCFTSTLKDKNGNVMYMIQNSCDPKIKSLQTDTLTFKEGNYAVIYENGSKRFVNLVSNSLTLKLSPGNAAFIMVY